MYLITGCAGFIGFHMCQYLLKKKLNVIGIDSINQYYSKKLKLDRLSLLKKNKKFKFNNINLCDKKKLELVLRKTEDLKIIHFAAQPGVMYSYKNPKTYYENNILATKNLVDVSKKLKILQFLFISSSSVYGDKKKYPIKENVQLVPINYYAKTKIECENIVHKNFKNSNHSTKILRPFTVYGPFGRPDMLIIKMLTFIKKNKEIGIYNFGNYLRDFTYVEDVVEILFKLSLKKNLRIKTFNICASKPIKINDILKLVKKYLKRSFKIKYFPKREGEMLITYGSNKNLLRFIKFKKFTTFNVGLKKTINWYKKYSHKNYLELHK